MAAYLTFWTSVALTLITLTRSENCSPDLLHGQRVNGYVVETVYNIGVNSCIKECLLRPNHCQSINYDTQTFTCELNSAVADPSMFIQKDSSIYCPVTNAPKVCHSISYLPDAPFIWNLYFYRLYQGGIKRYHNFLNGRKPVLCKWESGIFFVILYFVACSSIDSGVRLSICKWHIGVKKFNVFHFYSKIAIVFYIR